MENMSKGPIAKCLPSEDRRRLEQAIKDVGGEEAFAARCSKPGGLAVTHLDLDDAVDGELLVADKVDTIQAALAKTPLFSNLGVASSNFENTLPRMDAPIIAKAALLQALVSGPGYGLDLIERVKKQTKGKIKLRQGSVYPALRDLEREGFLDSYEGEPVPERGGRPRRFYKLNAAGAKAAMEQREVVFGLFGPAVEVR